MGEPLAQAECSPDLCGREVFEQVAVNPESGTVERPGDVDLDPELLYGRYEPASGHRIERRTVREPATATR